ncbi:MAG: hypothetical protein ABIP55_05245 [Tepidisphaeraceae bacterium]
MTPANLLMLGVALLAFAIGTILIARRGGSEAAVVARRIAGMMALALGIFLAIFAIGLSEPAHA